MPSIVDGAEVPYFATACPSEPFDLITKVKKGLACAGNAFILVLTPCPTGWIFPSAQSNRVGKLAVQTGYFPLYEIEQDRTRITRRLLTFRPLQEFLAVQKRFLTFPPPLIPVMQKAIEEFYKSLSDALSVSKTARPGRKK